MNKLFWYTKVYVRFRHDPDCAITAHAAVECSIVTNKYM